MDKSERISIAGIGLNLLLFIAKLFAGIITGSLSVLSDAFNSLTDIISYTCIFIAVRISNKKADQGHPFGHHRAEPIAGLIVAIFAGILAFEIIRSAVRGLFYPEPVSKEGIGIIVLLGTIVIKSAMSYYLSRKGRELRRPALSAAGVDSRNDVLVSAIALLGVVGPWIGIERLDSVSAFVISLFIFYSGYRIAIENLDYLMGRSPAEEEMEKIRKKALSIKGVTGLNDVRAHYVGNFIHVEIHIEMHKDLTLQRAHEIGKDVQRAVEKMEGIDKAFIHIDPR